MNRRDFIDKSSLLLPSVLVSPKIISDLDIKKIKTGNKRISSPYVISTWNVPEANLISGESLDKNMNAIDAAIRGVAYEEANIKNTTKNIPKA